MNTFNPDTYCGIYCGACSVAMYGKTGHTDNFSSCLGSVPKDDIVCRGCKSDIVYYGCRICAIRSCAREKKFEHCIDCSDYQCKTYKNFQKAAKLLPHLHGTAGSMEYIKREGVRAWLDSQKKEWSCPSCGTPFSWYASICPECGCSLSQKAYKLSGWKKFICRFILPMVYRKGKAKSKN